MDEVRSMVALRLPVRADPRGRLIDLISLTLTAVFLTLLVVDLVPLLPNLDPAKIAVDYNLYMEATRRFFEGGGYYLPYQTLGPYPADPGVILYPPPFTLIVAPFLVLPWIFWWLVPIGIVVAVVWYHRPRIVAWPFIAACLWFPGTTVTIVAGNPTMLFVAGVALATVWAIFGPFALLKPSLFPFAVIGIRRRAWWVGLLIVGLVSLPFGGMWIDYAKVLLNAQHPLGLLYNLGQVPTMLLPVVAWLGRSRRHAERTGGLLAAP
jgi:hypothetical protein